MDHFNPDPMASTHELTYEPLPIDQITEPFIAFICMSMLSVIGLFVEIVFDKVGIQRRHNTEDVVEVEEENYQFRFTVRLTNNSRDQFEILLRDFNAHNIYVNKIHDINEAFEY